MLVKNVALTRPWNDVTTSQVQHARAVTSLLELVAGGRVISTVIVTDEAWPWMWSKLKLASFRKPWVGLASVVVYPSGIFINSHINVVVFNILYFSLSHKHTHVLYFFWIQTAIWRKELSACECAHTSQYHHKFEVIAEAVQAWHEGLVFKQLVRDPIFWRQWWVPPGLITFQWEYLCSVCVYGLQVVACTVLPSVLLLCQLSQMPPASNWRYTSHANHQMPLCVLSSICFVCMCVWVWGVCESEMERGTKIGCYTVHSESIQTPWLFLHFVTLQPYSKMY